MDHPPGGTKPSGMTENEPMNSPTPRPFMTSKAVFVRSRWEEAFAQPAHVSAMRTWVHGPFPFFSLQI